MNFRLSFFMACMFLLCTISPAQGAMYTNSNPLVIGFDDNPVAGDKDYQDMIIHMTGNFNLVAGCGIGQTSCNATGAWQAMVTPNELTPPYWDGNSGDSTQPYNVGNYVLGTGGFTGNTSRPAGWTLANTQYFGTSSGGAAGFYFTPISGSVSTLMTVEVTSNANINYLAYALLSAPNVDYVLLSGAANPGTSATFTPNEAFILKFSNGSSILRTDGNVQAAAAFQGGEVPEPMTFALIGAGLAGIAALRRRRES